LCGLLPITNREQRGCGHERKLVVSTLLLVGIDEEPL
jgi:hypothetical protein